MRKYIISVETDKNFEYILKLLEKGHKISYVGLIEMYLDTQDKKPI